MLAQKLLRRFSCVFCGQSGCVADSVGNTVCDRCLQVLPRNEIFCERCGQPLITAQLQGVMCASCQAHVPAYFKARAPFRYAFPVDSALKALKFRRQLMYAPAFATLLLPSLAESFSDVDCLVAVPLHRRRQAGRGFNQATELCRTLVKHTNLPVFTQVKRTRHTSSQSGLSAAARQSNLRNAFTIRGNLTERYPLIIDDVITTGATCEYLARALLAAGARRVSVLTVARSSLQDSQ